MVCATLNYIEHFLILASTITGCNSSSVFPSLVSIHIEITSSAVELKMCAVAVSIKKCKSTSQQGKDKETWENSIVRKSKLNSIEFLISEALFICFYVYDIQFTQENKIYNHQVL